MSHLKADAAELPKATNDKAEHQQGGLHLFVVAWSSKYRHLTNKQETNNIQL